MENAIGSADVVPIGSLDNVLGGVDYNDVIDFQDVSSTSSTSTQSQEEMLKQQMLLAAQLATQREQTQLRELVRQQQLELQQLKLRKAEEEKLQKLKLEEMILREQMRLAQQQAQQQQVNSNNPFIGPLQQQTNGATPSPFGDNQVAVTPTPSGQVVFRYARTIKLVSDLYQTGFFALN